MKETGGTGSGIVVGKLIKKVNPDYPGAAKAGGVQGTVVIQAVIAKDGHILGNLRAVSGPPELRASALDAARQWIYTPYLLNGQPVEVETLLKVAFFLPMH